MIRSTVFSPRFCAYIPVVNTSHADDCFEESFLDAQFGMKKEEVWSYSNHFSKCHSKIETVLLKERPRSAVEKRQFCFCSIMYM